MRRARLALAGLLLLAAAGCRSKHYDPGEIADQEEADGFVRIRYGSIDIEGDDSTVGGLVAVPAGTPPAEGWPIVAYAHGTTGNADDCAPSDDPTLAGVDVALRTLAGAGFVAVATDYEGIGTSGPHPYLNGPSEARAVVDSVRAARAVVPEAGTRWAVLGYSQGGHAALWTAELAAGLAPELQLLGAAVLAPVTEPAELTIGGPHIEALMIDGWLASTPDVDEDVALTEAGREAAELAEEECQVAPSDPALVTEAGAPAFETYLAANNVGTQPVTVPVLVLQGNDDPLVTAEVTQRGVDRLCAAGTVVDLRKYDEADHLTIVEVATPDAVAWLADRFAGVPPPSSC